MKTNRISLERAEAVAKAIVEKLSPYCIRLEVCRAPGEKVRCRSQIILQKFQLIEA